MNQELFSLIAQHPDFKKAVYADYLLVHQPTILTVMKEDTIEFVEQCIISSIITKLGFGWATGWAVWHNA